jgi:thiosulfate dehydrogenase [quinone] large subunit
MLPVRLFLGITFIYAGLDKILDPTFLRASGPGSIAAQLEGFTRVSPIGGLVQLFEQHVPVQIGWLIALGEIGIGLAALTGIAIRLAAAGGVGLALLFWLTASWPIQPYFYGPDLPYAFAWLTLLLVGDGGRFTLANRFASREEVWGRAGPVVVVDRRVVLQAAVLATASLLVAGVGGAVGGMFIRWRVAPGPPGLGGDGTGTAGGSPAAGSPGPVSPSVGPSGSAAPGVVGRPSQAPAAGILIARTSQMTGHRAVRFTIPETGDPGVAITLATGSVVAYDATCTHAGCEVDYDGRSGLLICPCHGATFDPAHNAEVLGGPTNQPLTRLPITVDAASGRVYLSG